MSSSDGDDPPAEVWIAKKRQGLSPVHHLTEPDQSHLPPHKRVRYLRYALAEAPGGMTARRRAEEGELAWMRPKRE